jgi:hypothetical protein
MPFEVFTVEVKPMSGAVCLQMVRCGKATCKCARSEKHKAYYRFWRDGEGRLRKAYVRQAELEYVRACIDRRLKDEEWIKRLVKDGPGAQSVKREIRAMLKQAGAPARIVRHYR